MSCGNHSWSVSDGVPPVHNVKSAKRSSQSSNLRRLRGASNRDLEDWRTSIYSSVGIPPWQLFMVVGGVELTDGLSTVCSTGTGLTTSSGLGRNNEDSRVGGPGGGGAVPCGNHSQACRMVCPR